MAAKKDIPEDVILNAIQRVADGETVPSICEELGVTHTWFYKWRKRYRDQEDPMVVRLQRLQEQNERLRTLYLAERLLLDQVQKHIQGLLQVNVVNLVGSAAPPLVAPAAKVPGRT